MTHEQEKEFNKYKDRQSIHWQEMVSRDIRKFNAYQQARYDWITRTTGDLSGKEVLDLGCGDGALTYILAKRGASVVGIDNNELGLKYARQNLVAARKRDNVLRYEFIHASVYQLPFLDARFDIVVACEVIEHLHDPARMLGEASRVLKNGGKFILTTPHRLTEIPHDKNHIKEYFPEEIKQFLEKYFVKVGIKLTHHVLWYGLYAYAFRIFRNRPLGRWLLNACVLFLGWNPFMIDYDKPEKFDRFTSILAWGIKR